jgi:hypothetical protein
MEPEEIVCCYLTAGKHTSAATNTQTTELLEAVFYAVRARVCNESRRGNEDQQKFNRPIDQLSQLQP